MDSLYYEMLIELENNKKELSVLTNMYEQSKNASDEKIKYEESKNVLDVKIKKLTHDIYIYTKYMGIKKTNKFDGMTRIQAIRMIQKENHDFTVCTCVTSTTCRTGLDPSDENKQVIECYRHTNMHYVNQGCEQCNFTDCTSARCG